MDSISSIDASMRAALSTGNLWSTLAITFGAGVATSLTPCVYPMIAVTVSVFGARQTKSRGEAALLSTSFVLGMAALFVPLGLVAALTGGVFGAALASPYVLVGLGLLFAAMSASMFGAFALDLPTGLKTRLADMGGVGVRGAFVLGMVSALIAAPCTGPVLGALLTWISSSRDVSLGALGLFAYALGLGLLFWVVGTFAIALPKSGRWLAWVKSVFGVVLLAAAFYYVGPLLSWLSLPSSLGAGTLLALGGVLVVSGLALGAIHLSFEYTERRERVQKAVGVALMVAGLLACVRGMEAPSHEGLVWREDFQRAEQEARASGRPMLVDFSASWCGACGELDRHTFSHPEWISVPARSPRKSGNTCSATHSAVCRSSCCTAPTGARPRASRASSNPMRLRRSCAASIDLRAPSSCMLALTCGRQRSMACCRR
jgi:thiol:disulfide interchange protein DsbD